MKIRRVGKEGVLGKVGEATDSDSEMDKLRRWRDTRKTDVLAQNWKLLHYLGFEPARRKRSLRQIESYDDLELDLMKNEQRTQRDLKENEDKVDELLNSGEVRERARRSPMQTYGADLSSVLLYKRSINITESENPGQTSGSAETLNVTMGVPGSDKLAESFTSSTSVKSNTNKRSQTVTNFTIGLDDGSFRVRQNISSAGAVPVDSSLEEALRRPAAAVRALVGPVVGRARAALLRLKLTEAARAERQETALAAAETAERQLQKAQREADRRSAVRQAAERRLWQLLDRTEAAARLGAQAKHAAEKEATRRETAESRLEAERRRRRLLRQEEAAAAARYSADRTRLQRRVQAARRQAVTQSTALVEARRQVDSAERKAREAEEERRQQQRQLRRLEAAERRKLTELQRHGAEQLSAAIREAEREERRAQEAEHAQKQAEHQTRPEPEPPPEPGKQG